MKAKDTMDACTATMIAEGVEDASEEKQIQAWQYLIDTGLCWQLQGFFGRGARDLIERGICPQGRRAACHHSHQKRKDTQMKKEHKIKFGTLLPDGSLVNQREIRQSDIARCPFSIFMPEHYREDGTCKCDDAEHRKMMIEQWEYSEDQFKNIPLREPVIVAIKEKRKDTQ